MKSIIALLLLNIGIATAGVEIKMNIEEVFVVPTGYDSNDNVEVTFLSQLPGPCFEPSGHKLSLNGEKTYELSFYAKLKPISTCQQNSDLIDTPVFYSQTIALGELTRGEYEIQFQHQNQIKRKSFSINEARSNEIDDMSYAPVSNVFIPELVYFSQDVKVILSGIIRSSCATLNNHNIEVTQLGNIFLIIPKSEIIEQSDCTPIEVPLQNIVSLGSIQKAGSYLIHVRSQSGLSVNKVFHVRQKLLDVGSVK